MKTQTKTTLILLGTLLVGMVVGFLGHGIYYREAFRRKAERLRTPEGFIERFERIIQPTESQRDELHRILEKHFQRMMASQEAFWTHMETFERELDSVLTEEQKKRLWEHTPRGPRPPRRHFSRRPRWRPGSPPLPPPSPGEEERGKR